jgi:hypothetical protein
MTSVRAIAAEKTPADEGASGLIRALKACMTMALV